MNFNEIILEKKLNIDTMGRDESRADVHHNPYQPTYYQVLELLKESGYIRSDNVIIDYGCGKGRVLFYFSYYTGCKCIGLEREDVFYYEALKNRELFYKAHKKIRHDVEIIRIDAEKYKLPKDADTVFFFNPFSVEIMRAVMKRIQESLYENQRRVRLIFYYLMDETDKYLSEIDELNLIEEIDCRALVSSKDVRHKLRIYEFI